MAKRFMFVCLGLLALAVAYHLGATKAESGAGSPFVSLGAWTSSSGGTAVLLALTEDGTLYWASPSHWPWDGWLDWQVWGQIPTGPTATQSTTWGHIKAELGK